MHVTARWALGRNVQGGGRLARPRRASAPCLEAAVAMGVVAEAVVVGVGVVVVVAHRHS